MDTHNKATLPTARQSQVIDRAAGSHMSLHEAAGALSAALGLAQPTRERQWATHAAPALESLALALRAHVAEVTGAGGLYDELRFDAPWLLSRVERLVAQAARIEAEAADLAVEIERVRGGDLEGIARIRYDASHMLTVLRDLMAQESDLIYERFNQPSALD